MLHGVSKYVVIFVVVVAVVVVEYPECLQVRQLNCQYRQQ